MLCRKYFWDTPGHGWHHHYRHFPSYSSLLDGKLSFIIFTLAWEIEEHRMLFQISATPYSLYNLVSILSIFISL